MSLEKLLFTHKPLARRITALQRNLIKILSEGVGKIQKPLVFLHFSAFLIYSHSRARCFASDFCVDISPVFWHFFAYRLRNCLFSCTDGVKWESFFHSFQSKTLLFCYFVHQPGFPLVAFPPSLAKTKLQPYSFAS